MASDLTIQGEVVVSSEKAEAAFDRLGDKADSMAAGVARSANEAGKAVDNIGAGAEKGAERFTRAEARMREAIKKSTQELQTLGKTASEKLEFDIAAKGLDASKFAPYIAELKKVESAHGNVGVSAAQTAAALRQLPAQFSDIIVSLQGGQKPLTVFLQQGSQIKDSFGGAGAAVRAMTGYVVGLINPLALLAAGVAAGAIAYNQGSKEADEYRKAIVLTGNAAGVTAGQLQDMAARIGKGPSTQREAAQALAVFVNEGKVASENLEQFTRVAVEFGRATGQSVDDVAKQFSELAKDPLTATLKLNDSMGFLTETTLRQIKALHDQGKETEAADVAQKAYAQTLDSRKDEIIRNLGAIESAWRGIKVEAGHAMDAFLDIGRTRTLETRLSKAQKALDEYTSTEPGRRTTEMVAAVQAFGGEQGLRSEIAGLQDLIENQRKSADMERQRGDAVKASGWLAQESLKHETELEHQRRAVAKATAQYQESLKNDTLTNEQRNELERNYLTIVTDITKVKGSESKSSTGQSEVAGIKAKTLAAREYYELLLKYGAQADQLTEGEKAVIRIQQELKTSLTAVARQQKEKALAAAQEEAAAERQVENEKKRIKGLEESKTAYAALIDATHKDALAIENHANELAASNAVWGKGKVAIEEYRLALIKAKLAEVENGSDSSYDPAYVASLREKAAAQEHVVNETRIADYKELAQKQTEWARQVAEEAVLYQDELALLGLTAREREKIVAVRKVELDLAKKKAEIERSGSTDDKKRELIAAAEATAEQAKATAIAKANLNELLDIVNSVDRTAQQVWTNVFEGGSNAFKKLGQTLKAAVLDLLYQLVLKKWVVSITANVLGSLTGGLPGLVSGGNGLLGLAGNAGSLYSLGSGAMNLLGLGAGAYGTASAAATAAAAGGSYAAPGMMAMVNVPGSAAAGAAASGGFSSLISAIPGWGWALGGLALLAGSGLFKDNSGTPHWGAGATYDNGALSGGRDIYDNAHFAMGIQGEYSAKVQPFVDGVVKGVGSTLDGISRAFGGKGGYQVSTAYADDSSKDPSFGSFRISKDGKSIVDWNDTRADKWAPRNFADGEEGQKLYLAEIAKDTRKVLLDMDLPSWAHHMLEAVGDAANMDDLAKVVQQIGEIQTLFVRLGDTLAGFTDITDKAFEALLNASGGAQALAANTDAFYQGFYSEDERKAIAKRQLSAKLKDLGVDIDLEDPEARKKYRKLVEDELAKANGEEAAKAVLKGNLTDAIVGKGGLGTLGGKDIESLVRAALGPDVAASDVDLGKLKEGLASLDTAGMSADKLKESVGKLLEPIVGTGKSAAETAAALLGLSGAFAGVTTSAEDAAAAEKKRKEEAEQARKEALDKAYGNLQNSVGLERDRLTQQRDAIAEQRSLTAESLSLITGVFDLVHTSARDLFGQVESVAQMQAAQGMVFIENALDAARGPGYLPDQKQLSEAISAARGGIDSGLYANDTERNYDRLVLANQLKSLEEISGKQKTAQEQQIELLDSQLKGIDKQSKLLQEQLDYWKQQIDIANGTLDATLSVTAAVDALKALMFPGQSDKGVAAGGGKGGAVFGGTDPGRGTSFAPQAPSKYSQVRSDGSGGNWYDPIRDESVIARLDTLSDVYHSFDGTGDLAGLAAAIKAAGGSVDDLSMLSGYYASDWRKALAAAGIPAFAVGTNYVPYDMPAVVHQGERIIPAADNRALIAALNGGQSNQELLEEVRALRAEVAALRAAADSTAESSGATADVLARVTRNGNGMVTTPAPI